MPSEWWKGKKWANQLFNENKKRDDRKLKKCLANNIKMIYVVDNEEYLENERVHELKVEMYA